MQTRSRARAAALATATLTLAALTGGALAAAPASAAAPSVTLFPTDALTVPDASQLTGKRVALPTAGCGGVTTCGLVERINRLDGFDLDPRLALDFDGPVDVAAVVAGTRLVGDGRTTGIDRVVYDAATHTVYAHPKRQLTPKTTYTLSVSGQGLPRTSTRFTTLSATHGLFSLRYEINTGRGFREAGIAEADRGLQIDAVVPADGTTFTYNADTGAPDLVATPAASAVTGTVVFGSYLAPSWLQADRTLGTTATGARAPQAQRAERLPFVLVLPTGTAPEGGWPTTLYGHGFTRSTGDVLLAALTNSRSGVATIGTDVVGHGFGPRSTWSWSGAAGSGTAPAYARGVDVDGDGVIGSTEGSSALVTGPAAGVGSSDALRQTTADQMVLVRAVQRGLDVSGSPASELRTTDVGYFGQSFGGIYGTMLAGVDREVSRAVLNVPGGPVTEIARLSPSFRPLISQQLQIAGLLNSTDPATGYFVESLPLAGEAPVLDPAPGSLAIQDYLARASWLTRPGSPETFAPLVRDGRALFQVAFGDQTVPNPTSATLIQAGGLIDRTALYRNDRTAAAGSNPHGFLLNPVTFGAAALQAQVQVLTFLTTGQTIDPDGPLGVWELSPPRSLLLPLNFGG